MQDEPKPAPDDDETRSEDQPNQPDPPDTPEKGDNDTIPPANDPQHTVAS